MTIGPKCKCADCGDIIQSQHVHDFVTCGCGSTSVDGGGEYLRVVFKNQHPMVCVEVVE